LAIGSLLESLEGFQLVTAFLIFPLFFLSGALFPADERLPAWLSGLVVINPLSYTVDGVRSALLGISVNSFYLNIGVILFFAAAMLVIGSVLFSRMK
ncbi:MAG TPA: ABC transporter permease, partial [Smithellaceae bacterium]|nr:ABC transporter permease [Smithellaceae bacterium]